MQDPGIPPTSSPPRRRRQERTVYTAEQQQELNEYFHKNRYPTYQERKALADRFKLQEHQIQVWFKNQRAKFSRMQRQSGGRGGRAGLWSPHRGAGAAAGAVDPAHDPAFPPHPPPADPTLPEGPDHSTPGAPATGPSNAGPAFPGRSDNSNPGAPLLAPSSAGPAFPGGPNFCCPGAPTLASSPAGPMFPGDPDLRKAGAPALARSPTGSMCLEDATFCSPYLPKSSSQGRAWGCPAQGACRCVPTVSPPGSVLPSTQAWPPVSSQACFTPESGVSTNFDCALSSLDHSDGPSSSSSSSSVSGHQEGDVFVAENDMDSRMLLNL